MREAQMYSMNPSLDARSAHSLQPYQNMTQSSSVGSNWQVIVPKEEPIDTPATTSTPIYSMYANILTPPDSDRISPSNDNSAEDMTNQSTLTPQTSPDNALRMLQMTFERDEIMTSPSSRKVGDVSGDEDQSENGDNFEETELKTPKVNAQGKVKSHKCKHCDFMALTKWEFWEHTRIHIRPEKLLSCPKCPFATEHKHHIEYHLNIHSGSKPFKCSQCSYTCVNKSMLRSHEKSHSTVYQFHCADCGYTSKYCHSFKQHLRRLKHRPGVVLNPDGTPNPSIIIDVYGTRRGPRIKTHHSKSVVTEEQRSVQIHQTTEQVRPQAELPFPFGQLFNPNFLPGFPLFPAFPAALSNPFLLHNLQQMAKEQIDSTVVGRNSDTTEPDTLDSQQYQALDLSNSDAKSHTPKEDDSDYDGDEEEVPASQGTPTKEELTCRFCDITFGDIVLYTMHMGYHGFINPFTCNMCGEECKDKISFFLHIARTPHS